MGSVDWSSSADRSHVAAHLSGSYDTFWFPQRTSKLDNEDPVRLHRAPDSILRNEVPPKVKNCPVGVERQHRVISRRTLVSRYSSRALMLQGANYKLMAMTLISDQRFGPESVSFVAGPDNYRRGSRMSPFSVRTRSLLNISSDLELPSRSPVYRNLVDLSRSGPAATKVSLRGLYRIRPVSGCVKSSSSEAMHHPQKTIVWQRDGLSVSSLGALDYKSFHSSASGSLGVKS